MILLIMPIKTEVVLSKAEQRGYLRREKTVKKKLKQLLGSEPSDN